MKYCVEMPEKSILCFEFKGRGIYSLNIYHQKKYETFPEGCHEKAIRNRTSILNGQRELVWKIWIGGGAYLDRLGEFTDILCWYMENGREGRKVKGCLKIDCVVLDEEEGILQAGTVYVNQHL